VVYDVDLRITRSPATAGKANRSLLFLEHRIPMPELFTELRFSVLREFWTQETWRPGSEGMSLSCREDRMMICGIVLRQHRNVTDDRRHPHAIKIIANRLYR